ncbi:MAG TPA: hypothetical protein VHX37_17135 [Acidobacteriaceae bacterium]|jgi:hypothetical protein|nr:hypothetical protein [Acidobacteriaceae bacterium]
MRKPGLVFGVACAIAVVAAGCSSKSSAASGGGGTDAAAAAAPGSGSGGGKAGGASYVGSPLSGQLTTGTITDPSLNNMVAATLTIPAGWKLQGIEAIMPCTPGPYPVFRAYSPDGLMQMRGEPIIGWKWNPQYKTNQTGCANISKPISAADFLTYYIGTMQGGVHVVGTMPVPAGFSQWAAGFAAQADQNNARLPQMMQTTNTADTAALRVEVVDGSFVVEERVLAGVVCSVIRAGAGNGGSCFARVSVLTAPQGRLDVLVQLVDSNNLPNGVATQQYKQVVMQRMSQKNQQQADQRMAAANARDAAFSRMMYSAFQQNMAMSAAQHQQFMQQQESSFESSMNNANASMNAQTTAASDWVDYSLDQQTVESPNGSISKVSSAYSQTWTNGSQWYQTGDPNSNPNGMLQGNWTLTTQVHGNGQPK